jgi:hypothetical protein
MAFYIYVPIFLVSLAGISVIFLKNLSEVQELPEEELKKRLHSSRSVRKDISERYLIPVKSRFYSVYLPAFWRASEAGVKKLRIFVLKLEKGLRHLSDNLHGKHINLDIGERSEYWQTLNGAKNGANGNDSKKNIDSIDSDEAGIKDEEKATLDGKGK